MYKFINTVVAIKQHLFQCTGAKGYALVSGNAKSWILCQKKLILPAWMAQICSPLNESGDSADSGESVELECHFQHDL